MLRGDSAIAPPRAEDIFALRSEAADLVKVTMSIFDMSRGSLSRDISRIILSVSVEVFPDPAAALTRRVLPCVSIAASCAGVQVLAVEIPP